MELARTSSSNAASVIAVPVPFQCHDLRLARAGQRDQPYDGCLVRKFLLGTAKQPPEKYEFLGAQECSFGGRL